MTWQQGGENLNKLESLSVLAVRLLRLTVFKKLDRGEQQLRASGVPADFTGIYKKHAREQTKLLQTLQEDPEPSLLLVHTPPGSAF